MSLQRRYIVCTVVFGMYLVFCVFWGIHVRFFCSWERAINLSLLCVGYSTARCLSGIEYYMYMYVYVHYKYSAVAPPPPPPPQ